jgi:uncharacterized lipoprotein YmbA
MMPPRFPHVACVVALVALVVVGCAGTPQTRFYSLDEVALPAPSVAVARRIGLGPVELPRYLDRPQIVSRVAGNRLEVDEFNRWGGPLDAEMRRVLRARLARGLDDVEVYDYASQVGATVDFRLPVDVRRFDGGPGGAVVLDVAWSIIDAETLAVVESRTAVYTANWETAGYAAYAAVLSDLLGRLGDDMAAALRNVSRDPVVAGQRKTRREAAGKTQ